MKLRIIIIAMFINSVAILSQSNPEMKGWYHLNGNLSSVKATLSGVVYACGQNGMVMVSKDFGNNWKQNYTGTNKDLSGIVIINDSIAIAVGQSGRIIRTTDFGESWTVINLHTVNKFDDIIAVDSILYVFEHFGAILKSTDLGNSWSYCLYHNTTIFKAIAINKDTIICAAGNGQIVRSFDGGQNWETIGPEKTGFDGLQLPKSFCYTEQKRLILCFDKSIAYSDDFGASWTIKNHSYSVDTVKCIGFSKISNKEFILINQYNKAYITDSNFNIKSSFNIKDTVFRNIASMYYYPSDCYFINDSIGFIVGENKYIMKTTDKGKTWNLICYLSNISYSPFYIVRKENDLMFSYSGTQLFVSSNDGITWKPPNSYEHALEGIQSINYCNKDKITFMDYSVWYQKYISLDTGKSFNSITLPFERFSNFNCSIYSDSVFSYYGDIDSDYSKKHYVIYSTENNGKDYFRFDLLDTVSIYKLFYCSENERAFCGGYLDTINNIKVQNGIIIYTKNKWKDWISIHIKNSIYIDDLIRIDDSNWVASSYYNKKYYLIKSSDGCKTWEIKDSLDAFGYYYRLSYDHLNKIIYATNIYRGILISEDFGDHWNNILTTGGELSIFDINHINNSDLISAFVDENIRVVSYLLKKIPEDSRTEVQESSVDTEIPNVWIFPPYPNPFSSKISFMIAWNISINVNSLEIKLYDINGTEIQDLSSIPKDILQNGYALINWDSGSLQSGLYYLQIKSGTSNKTVPIIKIK